MHQLVMNSLGLINRYLTTNLAHWGSILKVRNRANTTARKKNARNTPDTYAQNPTPKEISLQMPSIELTPMQRGLQEFYHSFA
jgi:hypothetical protein